METEHLTNYPHTSATNVTNQQEQLRRHKAYVFCKLYKPENTKLRSLSLQAGCDHYRTPVWMGA